MKMNDLMEWLVYIRDRSIYQSKDYPFQLLLSIYSGTVLWN